MTYVACRFDRKGKELVKEIEAQDQAEAARKGRYLFPREQNPQGWYLVTATVQVTKGRPRVAAG